jgi:hypothetical protein
MTTEAKESPLLRFIARKQPVGTLQAGEDLVCSG